MRLFVVQQRNWLLHLLQAAHEAGRRTGGVSEVVHQLFQEVVHVLRAVDAALELFLLLLQGLQFQLLLFFELALALDGL